MANKKAPTVPQPVDLDVFEVPGVTRLSAWPKSVKPEDQDQAAEVGVRHVPIVVVPTTGTAVIERA